MTRHLGFLALLVALVALPAMAKDHDADYYKRTATAAPGDWYMGFRATGFNHAHGIGLATAGVWKNVGKYHTDILWSADLSAVKLAGQAGTVPFGCYQVPFSAPDRTVGQLGTSVLFKVGK